MLAELVEAAARREIAAKHPVPTPLAELVEARRGQAPKKRKAIIQTFSAVAYFDAARPPLLKTIFLEPRREN